MPAPSRALRCESRVSAVGLHARGAGDESTRIIIERHDPCTPLGGSLTHPPLSGPEPILPTCQLASQMIPDSQQELKGARIGSK